MYPRYTTRVVVPFVGLKKHVVLNVALTETQCRTAAAPAKNVKKYFDGGGLCLQVTPDGKKYWRLYYRMPGSKKQQTVSFGVYPKVSLKQARQRRDEVKLLIARGIDPKLAAKQLRQDRAVALENTFADVARRWLEHRAAVKKWGKQHQRATRSMLERYMYPRIGDYPVTEIEPTQILRVLQELQSAGKIETSHKLLSATTQEFRYAMITIRICKYNPAADLSELLETGKSVPYRHITDPAEIGRLLVALDEYTGSPQARGLARLHPLIFTRPTEIRLMRWDEIDFEQRLWRRSEDETVRRKNVNAVPFSRQAWEIIASLHLVTGRTDYVFCNIHRNKPFSAGAESKVLKSIGYHEKIVPHGWRHTASTLLHNQDYDSIWVEKQLGHTDKNEVRGTYNHADYLEQRRRMLQEWADYLDTLKANVK